MFVGGDADWSEVNGSKTSYDEGVMLEDGIETTKTEQIAAWPRTLKHQTQQLLVDTAADIMVFWEKQLR